MFDKFVKWLKRDARRKLYAYEECTECLMCLGDDCVASRKPKRGEKCDKFRTI